MFDLSLAEVALIVVVAVIFIGPKELPVVVKAVAKAMRSARALGREVKAAFDEVSKESGLKDVAQEVEREVRMIKGNDGQWYESCTIPASEAQDKPNER